MPTGGAAARSWLFRALEWLPVVLAAVYAVVLLVKLQATVDAVYSNADVASAPVIGDLFNGGPVRLGYVRWFEAFWLERATAWVPGHRDLWTYGAYCLTLVSLAAVAWSAAIATRRRWTGLTFFAVPFCATAPLMMMQFAWSIHALAWVHVLVTAAFLVACAATGGWLLRRRSVHLPVTVLLCAVDALGVASDRVLVAALALPALAGGILFMRMLPQPAGRRVGATALAVGASSLLLAPVFSHLADNARISAAALDIHVTPSAVRGHNFGLFWKAAPRLLGGDWSIGLSGARHGLTVLCALIAAGLLIAGIAYAISIGLKTLRPPRDISPPLTVLVTFWALSTAGLIGAFVFTTAPRDIYSSRYLVAAAYGVVLLATVAAAARRWSRAVVGAACAVLCVAGIVSLADRDLRDRTAPTRGVARLISKVGRQFGVTKGYAGYWTAAPVTWYTGDAFRLYPAAQCRREAICRFNLHYLASWYRDSHQRSMIVVDHAIKAPNVLVATDPRFGKPIFGRNYGRIQVFVYPYDVATKFAPK